jgi:Amt family ammonium transporter
VFSAASLGGAGIEGTIMSQVGAQGIGVGVTIIYTGVVSFVLLKIIDALVGLRVDEDAESEGLDLNQHDERSYII